MKYISIGALIFLVACGQTTRTVTAFETVQVEKIAPIVPAPDQLRLQPVTWNVLTLENYSDKFKKAPVYYALTEADYRNLAYNMKDLQAYLLQQKSVVKAYEDASK